MTIGALIKPIGELTVGDIKELVDERIEEGESVEFKEALSSIGNTDQTAGKGRISNEDKAKILKEIIAFANGYGGRLFIGIGEESGNEGVAERVMSVKDCVENAEKLRRACGDLIDPPVLRLDVKPIETQGDGSGVIVIDVPVSIRSPHMSKRDSRCYRRRGSESVPMDMRDIQDMTLRSANRFGEIEAEFAKRSREFEKAVKAFVSVDGAGYSFRLSFVPLDDVDLGHVHGNEAISPVLGGFNAHYRDDPKTQFVLAPGSNSGDTRPVVRGTQIHSYRSEYSPNLPIWDFTLWSDGGMEVRFHANLRNSDRPNLYLTNLIAWVANGLFSIERIRIHVGLPTLSYSLEAQLVIHGEPVRFWGIDYRRSITDYLTVESGVRFVQRYPIGANDTFDSIVSQFAKDCYNDAGIDWREQIVVDYGLD